MVSERSGNVWFKTKNYSGINCLERWYNEEFQMYEYQFNYLESDVMDEYSLASNDISAFIDDKAGNIWIGTRGVELAFIQLINLSLPLYHMILIMNGV